MSDSCIFCRIAAGEMSTHMVYEDERVLAFTDMNPVAPTHILVIPRKHISGLSSSTDEDDGVLGHLQAVIRKIADGSGLSDFRVVANNGRGAGQSVFHLHYHLLSGRRMNWPPG